MRPDAVVRDGHHILVGKQIEICYMTGTYAIRRDEKIEKKRRFHPIFSSQWQVGLSQAFYPLDIYANRASTLSSLGFCGKSGESLGGGDRAAAIEGRVDAARTSSAWAGRRE